MIVTAKCYRSMRKSDTPHSLQVCFDPASKLITVSKCSCTAGLSGYCSHLIGLVQALMHYQQWGMKEIPTEMSCTEMQQRWGKPRGSRIKPESVMALVCAKVKPDGQQTSRHVTATITKQRVMSATPEAIQQLKSLKGTPLSYLLDPSLPVEQTVVGPVQIGSPLPFHVNKYEERRQPSDIVPCGNTEFPSEPEAGSYPRIPPHYSKKAGKIHCEAG